MTRITLLVFVLLFTSEMSAQKKIVTPIAGTYGQDYIIVNHVDWGPSDTINDLHCGTKTYNGHQGTDFTIRNFKQMDSGVAVLATDTGLVTFIKDGLFDKETTSVISKGLGNYIAIAHSGKFYSYYGHLKKNSILVKEGDQVLPGQKIAEVGSSGNSTDPHLHFEWWYDSSVVIDPFRGPCGNSYSYWKNASPYDTSFNVWMSGLYGEKLSLNKMINGLESKNIFVSTEDSFISYGSLMYGLRKGDKLKIEWYNMFQSLYYDYEITLKQDYWYYYYWSFIDFPKQALFGNSGSAVIKVNEIKVDEISFTAATVSTNEVKEPLIHFQVKNHKLNIEHAKGAQLILYSIDGKLLAKKNIAKQSFSFDLKQYSTSTAVVHIIKDNQVLKTEKLQVN